MCGKKLSIYGDHIPRRCIESMHFHLCPGKYKQDFLKICFLQDEEGGENYDLLYQNSIRKYKDDLEHYVNFKWYLANNVV